MFPGWESVCVCLCVYTCEAPRSSCSFMWAQPWWRADLAPQRAHTARLYLQIRQRSAGPLYPLAFYLGAKADLDPVALNPPTPTSSIRLSLRLSVTLISHVCHFHLSLSSLSLSFSPSLTLHLPPRQTRTHTSDASASLAR